MIQMAKKSLTMTWFKPHQFAENSRPNTFLEQKKHMLFFVFRTFFDLLYRQILISLAFLGGSLCAAFVVALAATWALCEAANLEDRFFA